MEEVTGSSIARGLRHTVDAQPAEVSADRVLHHGAITRAPERSYVTAILGQHIQRIALAWFAVARLARADRLRAGTKQRNAKGTIRRLR